MGKVSLLGRVARAALLRWQESKCAVCKRSFGPSRVACIDHDHRTGLIRGALCWRCNDMLGLYHDDASLFYAAWWYLRCPPAVRAIGEHYAPGSPGAAGKEVS